MITRDTLLQELAALDDQRQGHLKDLERIDGAKQMANHLLGKIDAEYASKAREIMQRREERAEELQSASVEENGE